MREYAKLAPQFWIGETGRQLRQLGPEIQLLALYLISCPHANRLGLYYLPFLLMAHETGLPIKGTSKALRSLSEVGFAYYDPSSECVWIPEMARYQIGPTLKPNDKQVKGLRSEYAKLPNNPFLAAFFDQYGGAYHLQVRRTFKAPSEPLRSMEMEMEREREMERDLKETAPQPHAAAPLVVNGGDPEEITPKPQRRVGSRIPDDWQPTAEDLAWAKAKGYDQVLDLDDFTEAFRYYWQSTTKNPTKLDWSKTWRNRLRDEVSGKVRRHRVLAPHLKALPALNDPELDALMAKKVAEEEEEARHAGERAAGI